MTSVFVYSTSRRTLRGVQVLAEVLEQRQLLSIVRPDHIVIVMEQDRASNALSSSVMPYFREIAGTGLVYSNSHGVTHPTQPNLLALYSGSTQGVTTNNQGYSFPTQANLAKSLFDAGFSFAGYSENLPSDGSQVSWSGDGTHPDLYVRYINPMAQFGSIGINPLTGQPRANAVVNRTFNAFAALPKTDYSSLPTVSLIIPNAMHSTHGSNEAAPWAGSPDEANNDILRAQADTWLRDNLNDYLEWAKVNNSLLIVTQDEERYTGGTADTVTTFINGDPDLFVAGTNTAYVNHYNLLRTILDMYGLAPLGNSATASPFDTNALGQLAPAASTRAPSTTTVSSSANPSVSSQSVSFTATVRSTFAGGETPAGTVQFVVDGSNFGSPVTLVNGSATSSAISTLATGSHIVTALYSGSTSYAASTSASFTQMVAVSNNNFASRIPLSGASVVAGGTNVGATKEPGEPSHAGNVGGKSVWWTWTAPSAGTVTIDTLGSSFDTLLAVYTGNNISKLAKVNGGNNNNDPAGGLTSRVSFATVAGRVYQIAVDGNNGASGNIALRLNHVPPAPGAPGGVNASDTLPDFVRVTWNAVSTATSYEVWRASSNSSAAAVKLADVVGATAHDDATAIAGVTYWYWVKARNAGGVSGFSGSNSGYRVNASVANDSFAARTTITSIAATILAGNAGATKDLGEPNHAGNAGGKSVWWTWTAPASGNVTIDTIGSSFNTLLAVYTGTAVNALTLVRSDNDTGGNGTSKLTFSALAGTAYQIAVDGSGGASGNIVMHFNVPAAPASVSATDGTLADRVGVTWAAAQWAGSYEVWRSTSSTSGTATKIADADGTNYDDLSAVAGTTYYYWVKARNSAGASALSVANSGFRAGTTTPATNNNNFADRATISGSSATITSTNSGATKEAGEPNHAGNVGGRSVWWTWTAPTSGIVTIDTAGSNFDTLLAVYTGSSLGALTSVASNDDDFNAGLITSKLSFSVTAGTVYQIAVDGYNGVAGSITLRLLLA